jgi:putative Mn2+ efflux pump MntP
LSWLNVLGIAIGLAMDAFAVSIAAGIILERVTARHVFRLSWHFGLFQFLMPIVGYLAGRTLAAQVDAYDHWFAFGLLTLVGGKMLIDAWLRDDDEDRPDPTRGWSLVTLSVATSIDALAVGLSLAFLGVPIILPSVVIGLVALLLTAVGITFGGRLFRHWGRGAEVLGGVVLLLIGLRVLISHLGE